MSVKKRYTPLTIPKLSWEKTTLSEKYGELIAQPLEPGFGITIGNALRRTLLGAIEGSAVTSVIVKGINNEFSAIDGVEEDGMQLLLNIKEIVIKNKTGVAGKMHLRLSGTGIARVSDIVADEHLVLINGDHVLAHVADDGELDIEFFVETGRGYQPAQWPTDKKHQEDGRMYLDASFSPVKRVSFDTEKTRVGEAIDYDKLILKIETDGSENPVELSHYAVSVLRTQLECFLKGTEIPFNEISAEYEQQQKNSEKKKEQTIDLHGISPEFLLKPVEELELSVRAYNCLLNANVKRIIDLVNTTEDDLLKVKNFGRKSLNEVKDSMKKVGISFGLYINEDDVKSLLVVQETNE